MHRTAGEYVAQIPNEMIKLLLGVNFPDYGAEFDACNSYQNPFL